MTGYFRSSTCFARSIIWLILIVSQSSFSFGLPTAIKTDSVTISTLPGLVEAFIKESPGKRGLDKEIILSAHRRFIEFLDPEKIYFLEKEITPFVDEAKAREYVLECTEGSFESYKSMIALFQKAIDRSENIRKRWSNRSLPRGLPHAVAGDFPKNERALEIKVVRFFLLKRRFDGSRISQDKLADMEERERAWSCGEDQALFAEMILKSILCSLDINSDLLGKKEARSMREKLTKEAFGTGLICEKTKDGVSVVSIQKGSPADELGVFHQRDMLLSINGKLCSQMTLAEIDELLRERERGVLSIRYRKASGGRALEQVIPLRHFTLGEDRVTGERHADILVVSVPSFYTSEHFAISTTSDISKILSEKRGFAGLVLDFRKNGGGYLAEAVRTCGLFVKTGVIMTAMYANGEKAVYRDTDPSISFSGPIIILTSEWTASAAETVTQTLKDYGRAIIVGAERTFGKGTIQLQTITDMKSSGNVPLRYTVGKFYSVAGFSPEGQGIEADIILPGFQPRKMHPPSAAALPNSIPAKFRDTLEDLPGKALVSYKRHYLPYLQQSESTYREHISLLKELSQKRMQRVFSEALLHSSQEGAFERLLTAETIATLQLQEAENILKDLLMIERKGESSVTSFDRP